MIEREVREQSDQIVEKKGNYPGNDAYNTGQQRNVAQAELNGSLAAIKTCNCLRIGTQSFTFLFFQATSRFYGRKSTNSRAFNWLRHFPSEHYGAWAIAWTGLRP